jgi:hypothetical protein
MTECLVCHKALTGGCDTFGDRNLTLCQSHWYEAMLVGEQELRQSNEIAASVGLPPMEMNVLEAGLMALADED